MKSNKKLNIVLSFALIFSMLFSIVALAADVHVVKEEEVLWKIAKQYGLEWQQLAKHNNLKNPDMIYPGQKLNIPTEGESITSKVENTANETTITVLGTADMHGRIYAYEYAIDAIDDDAGFAKIQTLIKQEKTKNPNAILMDMGDTVQDNSAELFNDLPVHPMVQAMNKMGYDVWTIGNHEFNFEKAFLDRNIAAFKGSVLAANIYKTDGSHFVKPYTIIDKNGVRVAIVGLITPHVPRWEASTPEHFQGLTFNKIVEEAKKAIKELDGKYDVLVGAVHEGRDGEYGEVGIKALAEACPEFDVIFGGHEHAKFEELEVNGVKLIEPGAYGWALAKADINLKKSGNTWKVENVTTKNIETKPVDEDKDILVEFESVHNKSVEDANVVVGEVTEDFIKRVDYITGDASVTTMPTAQLEDTALIDLINEVQIFYTGAEVSAAAAFKNDMNLVAGVFKKKNATDIYKYTNTLLGVNITGANLKKYMEWSASYYNTYKNGDVTISFNPSVRGYNYDMFAGVTYDIDISKESGSRITNVTLNGKPIEDNKTYKLAVNNYRFGTLTSLNLVTDADKYYDSYEKMQDAGRIRDLIAKYIREEKGGKVTPKCDNNWKIVGADLNHPLKETIYEMIRKGEIKIPTSEDGRTPNVKAINVNDLNKEGKLSEYKTLTILHTNDVHGYMVEGKYDGMGYSKMSTKVKQMRENQKNVLLLDAGDAIQGSNLATLSKGETVISVMNALKYDAMVAGNHEFDYGKERLKELESMAKFPILSANVKYADGKEFLKPYIIKEIDGIKVGIFGLTTPETTYKSHPKNTEGLKIEDTVATAKKIVAELEGKTDIIIALAHLGIEGDYTSTKLAKSVTGIDVIIDGHSHSKVENVVENGTMIVQAGEKSNSLGVIQFALKDGNIASKKAYLFDKNQAATLTEDAQIKALVDNIQTANKKIESEVVAKSPINLDGERDQVRTGETNLGNLITAAMMNVSGADVALMNGGGIRTSIPAGDVTKGQILSVLPFGNTVKVIEVSGADIKAMMENGLSTYPEALGGFSHIAGMTVTFDQSKEKGNRVVEIKVAGKLLDRTKTYKLVTNDFLAAGGDGYTMFIGKKVIAEYNALDQELINFIQKNGFNDAKVDGRIKAIDKTSSIEVDFLIAA